MKAHYVGGGTRPGILTRGGAQRKQQRSSLAARYLFSWLSLLSLLSLFFGLEACLLFVAWSLKLEACDL
jgi:hypothetical protein